MLIAVAQRCERITYTDVDTWIIKRAVIDLRKMLSTTCDNYWVKLGQYDALDARVAKQFARQR